MITPMTDVARVRFITGIDDIAQLSDLVIQQLLLDKESITHREKRIYLVCAEIMERIASNNLWNSISMGGVSMSQSTALEKAKYFKSVAAKYPSIYGSGKNIPTREIDNNFYHHGDTIIQR
jgi:hypothetical protein